MRVEDEVLKVLSNADCTGNCLKLVGQLDRKLYLRTNAVIEAAGGKWSKKAKGHIFEGPAGDAMEAVILTGDIVKPQDFGFFETPTEIVQQLIADAYVKPGMEVLEPSAGRGAIADAVRAMGAIPTCCEIQDKNVAVLAEKKYIVRPGDFLKWDQAIIEERFDAVVMNPPFARRADIKHIMHAAKFLRPGGRLASIASSPVAWRDDKLGREFRAFVEARGGTIEQLPEGSFKSSGTMVNTCLVAFDAA